MKREGDVFNYCGYDFECIQNSVNEKGEIENEGEHRVNLAVLRKVCDDCHLDHVKDHLCWSRLPFDSSQRIYFIAISLCLIDP